MNRIAIFACLTLSFARAQDARTIVEEVQKRSATKSQKYEGSLEVVGYREDLAHGAQAGVFEQFGFLAFLALAKVVKFRLKPQQPIGRSC